MNAYLFHRRRNGVRQKAVLLRNAQTHRHEAIASGENRKHAGALGKGIDSEHPTHHRLVRRTPETRKVRENAHTGVRRGAATVFAIGHCPEIITISKNKKEESLHIMSDG
jgi:hypothetical protein